VSAEVFSFFEMLSLVFFGARARANRVFFAVCDVDALVDVAKGAATDLAAQPVLVADSELHLLREWTPTECARTLLPFPRPLFSSFASLFTRDMQLRRLANTEVLSPPFFRL
jgi:hypothetical protein